MSSSKRSNRQTLSYLRTMFEERGIQPKTRLGQNFLIDLNLLEVLAAAGEITRDDLVLEVGSGTGGLTARLAEEAGAVLSVEIDPDFSELTREMVEDDPHVVLHQGDILRNKNELNPEVLEIMEELQEKSGTTKLKLVANLPYAVATPVMTNLLLSDLNMDRLVGTVQWEIAEKLSSTPSHKEFGALAVLVQSIADVDIIRQVPPTAFWPRPKVNSGIVRITPNAEKRAHVGDPLKFRHFLRDLYVHKRKNLRSALSASAGVSMSKSEIDEKLEAMDLEGTIRAETLNLEQHLQLSRVFG